MIEENKHNTNERLWNANFVKVFTGNFLLFFAFYVVLPVLPLYLRDTFDADKQMIGIVLSGYTLTALLVRPFSGWMVDSFNRKAVLLLCYFVFFIWIFAKQNISTSVYNDITFG